MIDVGLLGAFLGGLFALVSPCSALLLPAFFAYAFGGLVRLASRTVLFYLGLAAVLVPIGAGVGAASALVTQYRGLMVALGGLLLTLFGLMSILGVGFSLLGGRGQRAGGQGAASVVALGAVYGFAGFCSGPLLGAVLTFALVGGSPAYGGALMAAYALGMAAPLFVLALLWDRLQLGRRPWLRGREVRLGPLKTHTTSLASGLVFVLIGLLFLLTDGTAGLSGLVGVEAQFRLQEWAAGVARRVPDAALAFLAAVVVGLAALPFAKRTRREAGGRGRA